MRNMHNRFKDYDMTNQPPPPDSEPPNDNTPKHPGKPHKQPLQVEPKPLLHTSAIEDMIEFSVMQYLLRMVSIQLLLSNPNITLEDRENIYRDFRIRKRDQTYLDIYLRRFPKEMQTVHAIHHEIENYIFNRCRELGTVFLNQMLEGYPNLVNHRFAALNNKLSELFDVKMIAKGSGTSLANYDMVAKKVSEIAHSIVQTIPSI